MMYVGVCASDCEPVRVSLASCYVHCVSVLPRPVGLPCAHRRSSIQMMRRRHVPKPLRRRSAVVMQAWQLQQQQQRPPRTT